ncbi:hypothetical protein JZ751_026194 [Albula glossodonta]|uniref:RGS domain-containing protein n=1 Tax=Albula glossodonta TaxID=121402 RepID=A0A8T2PF75_9TELE|nr:hypothetical protein JZ751_026194 [Albula glossodonta]
MSVREKGYPVDLGGNFTEDAPRPPVPGEEGELVSSDVRQYNHSFYSIKSESLKNEASTATPRRPDLDLGYEPEGSASPTPPYLKWAESLHSLLDDQDGIHLFRTFLKQEDCADLLDFWFACSGFRKLEANECSEEKKLKLAKAIYKKYILDNNGIVSRQIKPATKSFIKDCVMKLHIDPAMFDQAQTEIQTMMEENTYPVFLKSDIYLEYTRTGGESPKLYSDQSSASGNGKVLPGYLPTLNEDEEWKCDQEPDEQLECDPTPTNRLTQKLLMETASQRAATNKRYQDSREYSAPEMGIWKSFSRGSRGSPISFQVEGNRTALEQHADGHLSALTALLLTVLQAAWREPINPYYVNTGYALAPATSANDSEQQSMSSDADTLSLTDSSVYRTYRMPKDIHVDPEKFAAELISRLEGVLREREAQEKLEERLKRVRLEEEGEDADVSTAPSLASHKLPAALQHYNARYSETTYNGLQLRDAHEENPESILDEHVQRVMKTPGCQSPGTGRHSPKSRSPDGILSGKAPGLAMPLGPGHSKHPAKQGLKPDAGSMYHHKHVYHIHHMGGVKPKEQIESEAMQRVQNSFAWNVEPHHYANNSKGSTLSKRSSKKVEPGKTEDVRSFEMQIPPEDLERNQKIIQWMMEGEKEAGRHKKTPYGSAAGAKKTTSHDVLRPSSVERPGAVHPWISAQLRNTVQPSHPFIQDPTMPPNPAPNPLTQLEEARRRLEEEKKKSGTLQTKQSGAPTGPGPALMWAPCLAFMGDRDTEEHATCWQDSAGPKRHPTIGPRFRGPH